MTDEIFFAICMWIKINRDVNKTFSAAGDWSMQ